MGREMLSSEYLSQLWEGTGRGWSGARLRGWAWTGSRYGTHRKAKSGSMKPTAQKLTGVGLPLAPINATQWPHREPFSMVVPGSPARFWAGVQCALAAPPKTAKHTTAYAPPSHPASSLPLPSHTSPACFTYRRVSANPPAKHTHFPSLPAPAPSPPPSPPASFTFQGVPANVGLP